MKAINCAEAIEVFPMTVRIGAEISGVDLSQPLDDAAFQVIYKAFLRWKVIFLRDQDITPEQHLAFARRFGTLELHPVSPTVPGHGELLLLARGAGARNGEDEFHADVTFKACPPKCSILRGIDVPAYGGDTIWIDMAAAYRGLSDSQKQLVNGLHGVHDFEPVFGHRLTPERLAEMRRDFPARRHPVVVRHPETGESILFVNRLFTSHLADAFTAKGMSRAESDALLSTLLQVVTIPENQVRFRWRRNSMAIWDNRATQHYAVYDYADPQGKETRRVMNRATVMTTEPPQAA
jgi:taurine dioxygenase